MSNTKIVTGIMPTQEVKPYPPGANSPMTAGIAANKAQIQAQMALIKGGATATATATPVVVVPPSSVGGLAGQQNNQLNAELTRVAANQAVNKVYDDAKTPAQTAAIAAQQQALYKGGTKHQTRRRRRRHRKNRRRYQSCRRCRCCGKCI